MIGSFMNINLLKLNYLLRQFFRLVVVFLVVLVLLLGYFFLLGDQYRQLKVKRDRDLVNNQKIIQTLSAKAQKLKTKTQVALTLSEAEIQIINLALPKSFDFSSLVVELDALSREAGLTLAGLELKEVRARAAEIPAEGRGHLKRVALVARFSQGDYDKFRRLIAAFESSIMIFELTAVTVSSDSGSYELELITYYYPN